MSAITQQRDMYRNLLAQADAKHSEAAPAPAGALPAIVADGENAGLKLAKGADVFITSLAAEIPNVTDRLELYKLHQESTAGCSAGVRSQWDSNMKLN